eukprot:6176519-Pleurochrysis_carterae.AAC.2
MRELASAFVCARLLAFVQTRVSVYVHAWHVEPLSIRLAAYPPPQLAAPIPLRCRVTNRTRLPSHKSYPPA